MEPYVIWSRKPSVARHPLKMMEENTDELAELIINEEQELQDDDNNNNEDDDHGGGGRERKEKIGLKRQINLLSTLSLLVGCIIGSGIFASPRSVAIYAGSTGSILLVWVGSGIISMLAGLVWAELGTMFPGVSGNEYSYLMAAYTPFPLVAFVYLFTSVICLLPMSVSIVTLVCGDYILTAFGGSDSTYSKLIAAAVICVVTTVNCIDVVWATRFQNIFTGAKLVGILMLVMTGIVRLAQGHTENFQDAFNGSVTDISNISYALYGGLWSYSGWNMANYVVAESTNPSRNLPLTIMIGVPFVIFCYVMVNVGYLTVLTPLQISNSSAVAVTLANQLYGKMAWVMPILVACSAIGSANANILCSGRLIYDGAKNGQLPKLLAALHTKSRIPIPAILFNTFFALVILIPKGSDFITLTNYFSFAIWMFYAMTTVGLFLLRYRRPNMKRPFKVFIGVPVILFLCSLYLIIAPFYDYPWESFYCLIFIFSSVPFYFAFVKYSIIPQPVQRLYDTITSNLLQRCRLSVPDLETNVDVDDRCSSDVMLEDHSSGGRQVATFRRFLSSSSAT